MKRRLPVLAEQAIGSVYAEATDKGLAFERLLRRNASLTCASGCAACCHHPVEVSLFEGIYIYRHLVQRGRWTPSFVERLNEHDRKVAHLSTTIWMMAKVPCPGLDEQRRCSLYEVRPFQCRTTWSVSDSMFCEADNLGPGTGLVPRAEISTTFRDYERLFARNLGMVYLTLPLGRALLLAARIVSGEVSLSDAHHAVFEDFRKGG